MIAPVKKEISCRITHTILMYVREINHGSLGNLLEGLDYDEAYLSDVHNWVPHALLQLLYARMIQILNDPKAVYKMCLTSERFKSLGFLDRVLRLLGNPKFIYTQAPKYNRLLKLNGDFYVRDSGSSWMILEDRYHDSAQKTRHDCDYTRGILTGVPTLFGLPPAHIEELACQVSREKYGPRDWLDDPTYGAEGCLYKVRFNSAGEIRLWHRLFRQPNVYRHAIEDLLDANRTVEEKYNQVIRLAADLDSANKQLRESKSLLEQSKNELNAEKERLAVTLHSIGDGVITTDRNGIITLINPVAERLTGRSENEAIGSPLQEIITIVDPKDGRPLERLGDTSGQNFEVNAARDCLLVGKEGKQFLISQSSAPIRDADNQVIGFALVFRDVTDQRNMQKELQKVEKLESLGIMAGGIAHDFNNFLSGIIGNLSLIKLRIPRSDKVFQRIEEIEKASSRAKNLTQQLLTFAKGGAPIKRTTELTRLIADAAEFATRGSNVRCVFDFTDGLLYAEVDEGQIAQVIHNLILNAVQAMPHGGTIHVRTEIKPWPEVKDQEAKAGPCAWLTVQDQGTGINAQDLKKIFDPYFTTKHQGSGLGLAVAYAIISKHNGLITVDSEPKVGTTFRIHLPMATPKEVPMDHSINNEDPMDDSMYMEELSFGRGRGRILVMDDEAFIRELAEEMLVTIGFEVKLTSDGEEAIAVYKAAFEAGKKFDAVVLDLTVPGAMGGLEAMKQLLVIDPEVKGIVSSGYSNDPVMAEFKNYGFQGAVQKPYRVQDINEALNFLLGK